MQRPEFRAVVRGRRLAATDGMMLPVLALAAGLDIGRVVDDKVFHDNAAAVDAVGVGWVRLNLRLDAWTSPDDPEWLATYDRVVDDYLARGIQIYALINDESTRSTAPHGSDAWIADYVRDA